MGLERVYWCDSSLKAILRSHLNGSNVEKVIDFGIESPEGLAIDVPGRKLYWTDSALKRVEVTSLDGRVRRALFWKDLGSPRAIAVDHESGWVWRDHCASSSIFLETKYFNKCFCRVQFDVLE